MISQGAVPVRSARLADPRLVEFNAARIAHWDRVAREYAVPSAFAREYYRRLGEVYRFLIPPGLRVLEVGCGRGDLLAALEPREGVGVDFSSQMVDRASRSHGSLRFVRADAHDLPTEAPFDAIILSDLLNDVFDVQQVLSEVRRVCAPKTRVVLNIFSHLWEAPLRFASALGLARPKMEQNWLTLHDVRGLLALSGFEIVDHRQDVLLPFPIWGLRSIANKVLVKLWPLRHLALTNIVVARPLPGRGELPEKPRVSVVVPARNEAGNIARIFREVPSMGAGTELLFVEGHSADDTYGVIAAGIQEHRDVSCTLYRQEGRGKGDAVRLGFEKASGDILMILDADLTVAPADLTRFYNAITSGKGEFINGVRLVYPMEDEAMRFFNLLGNKFFSWAFSWLLGQPIKDTLCGTKVLWKSDYLRIAANRRYFGDFDPFGDFDLLFGAAKLNLKIIEVPIRYGARQYGTTNIQRWRHGWLLTRMVVFAARRIKFV